MFAVLHHTREMRGDVKRAGSRIHQLGRSVQPTIRDMQVPPNGCLFAHEPSQPTTRAITRPTQIKPSRTRQTSFGPFHPWFSRAHEGLESRAKLDSPSKRKSRRAGGCLGATDERQPEAIPRESGGSETPRRNSASVAYRIGWNS